MIALPIDLYGETDIGPPYEWYREMALDLTDPPLPVPAEDGAS